MKKYLVLLGIMFISVNVYAKNAPDLVNASAIDYKNGDYRGAFIKIKKAASLGDSQAYADLAILYAQGFGVDKDYNKAVYWLQKGINAKNKTAYYNLAYLYMVGEGVSKNTSKAFELYTQAAKMNYKDAQKKLAGFYMKGSLVKRNLVQAYKWYSLAALQGDQTSASMLSVLSQQMTKEQLSQANKLVQQFKPKK